MLAFQCLDHKNFSNVSLNICKEKLKYSVYFKHYIKKYTIEFTCSVIFLVSFLFYLDTVLDVLSKELFLLLKSHELTLCTVLSLFRSFSV